MTGEHIHSLSSPALVVDAARFEANVAAAETLAGASGTRLRPHVKTHRCSGLALRQLGGAARGVTCATVGEVEAMTVAGIDDVLVANEVTSTAKLERLAGLGRVTRISLCRGLARGVSRLFAAAAGSGTTVEVLVDVDVGLGRCGVATAADAAALARSVAGAPGLRFAGLMEYEGRIRAAEPTRPERLGLVSTTLAEAPAAVLDAGLPVESVSSGGTSTRYSSVMASARSASRRIDIDLLDYDRYVEGVPFETFDFLRRETPVFWHDAPPPQRGFWAVTKHADVVRVHHDPRTFSSEVGAVSIEDLDEEQVEIRKSLIDMDPPRHTQLRSHLNRHFTPRAVEGISSVVRPLARQVVHAALEKRDVDLAEDVSKVLPILVLCRLMGLPDEDGERILLWGDALFGNTDPEYSQAVIDRADTEPYRLLPFRSPAGAAMFEYASSIAAERRRAPGADLVSSLLDARIDGAPLTERHFLNNFQLLAVAGNETTRHAISHGILALMEHPDQLDRLRGDSSLMPTAVEEILRWATPIYQFRRTATRDVELRGTTICRGDKVVTWYISANRDEEAFIDPYRFDIARRPNDHTTFGLGGPHYCLGAHLARLEIRALLEEFLPRVSRIETTGPVVRLRSNFINGIKHMPVRIDPIR